MKKLPSDPTDNRITWRSYTERMFQTGASFLCWLAGFIDDGGVLLTAYGIGDVSLAHFIRIPFVIRPRRVSRRSCKVGGNQIPTIIGGKLQQGMWDNTLPPFWEGPVLFPLPLPLPLGLCLVLSSGPGPPSAALAPPGGPDRPAPPAIYKGPWKPLQALPRACGYSDTIQAQKRSQRKQKAEANRPGPL